MTLPVSKMCPCHVSKNKKKVGNILQQLDFETTIETNLQIPIFCVLLRMCNTILLENQEAVHNI